MCPEDANCCPYCGADLSDAENHSSATVGDNNTFTGGVHSTDNRTTTNSNNVSQSNSNNTTTTNYTTINEAVKSKSDLLEKDLEAFRLECKKQYKNGLISKEGEDILRELQARYALPDELVLPIKEKIQKHSRKPITQLSGAVLSGIRQTRSIIEQNAPAALQRQLQQLGSWMQEYEDDALKSYYFQLSSMLEPVRYTDRYEKSAKDEYWEVYWAYIAYLLQNKERQAFAAQASLGRLQSAYPEQNEVLLTLVGRLMQNDPIGDIKQEYNVRALHGSQELQLLLETIEELLQKDWSSDSIAIRPVHAFYADTLFKSFVDTQKAAGEVIRDQRARMSRAEQERQNEINRQKAFLLQKFQEVEDMEKACQILGVPYLTFQGWLKEDPTFNSSYNELVHRIEGRRAEEAEKARLAQEFEAKVRQQKSQFVSQYDQNDGDFIRTCSDLGIGSDTVRMWRMTDKAFDDGLTLIERKRERNSQELFVQFYESNGCALQKACAETGISVDKVNEWRHADKAFDEVLTAIENEHLQEKKDAFVECYKYNDCNLLKTCNEMGIDSSTFREWLDSDQAFADRIKYLENEINKKRREEEYRISRERNKKRKERFKKTYLPIILSAVLLVAICLIISPIISKRIEEANRKENLLNQYNELLIDFDRACSRVDRDAEQLNDFKKSITKVEDVLSSIKAFENNNTDIIKPRYDSLAKKSGLLYKDLDSCLLDIFTTTQSDKDREFLMAKINEVDSAIQRLELSKNQ